MQIDYTSEYTEGDRELLDTLDTLSFQYQDAVDQLESSLQPSYAQSLISRALALQQNGTLPEDDKDELADPSEKATKAKLADFLLKLGGIYSTFASKLLVQSSPIVVEDTFLQAEIYLQKVIALSGSVAEMPQKLQDAYISHIDGHVAWLKSLCGSPSSVPKLKIERDIRELTRLKSYCPQLLTEASILRFGFVSAREIVGGEHKTETVSDVESRPVARYFIILRKNKISVCTWADGEAAPTVKYETPLMLVAFLNMSLNPPKDLPPYLKFSFAKKTQDGLEATYHFMHDSFISASKGVVIGRDETGAEAKLPVKGWLQGDRMWLMCITAAFQEDRRQRQQQASNALYNMVFAPTAAH